MSNCHVYHVWFPEGYKLFNAPTGQVTAPPLPGSYPWGFQWMMRLSAPWQLFVGWWRMIGPNRFKGSYIFPIFGLWTTSDLSPSVLVPVYWYFEGTTCGQPFQDWLLTSLKLLKPLGNLQYLSERERGRAGSTAHLCPFAGFTSHIIIACPASGFQSCLYLNFTSYPFYLRWWSQLTNMWYVSTGRQV